MESFMPWHGLVGGVLIGLAAGFHLLVSGRIAGVSGIVEEALRPSAPSFLQSIAFVIGLPLGGVVVAFVAPALVPSVDIGGNASRVIAAGVLIGLGARIGGGCTSGHGVCGVPRLSLRSIVATLTFVSVAVVTVLVTRHLV